MTDTKMSFKDALSANLLGESVECSFKGGDWICFEEDFANVTVSSLAAYVDDSRYEFRIKPRTVICNGVEVPAPERVSPENRESYYTADVWGDDLYADFIWRNDKDDQRALQRGLVYLNKDDAIARAKAMLITK